MRKAKEGLTPFILYVLHKQVENWESHPFSQRQRNLSQFVYSEFVRSECQEDSVVVQRAMNSQDLPAKGAPLTVNEQVRVTCLVIIFPSQCGHTELSQTLITCAVFKFFCCSLLVSFTTCNIPYHSGTITFHTTQQFIEIRAHFCCLVA